MVIITRMKFWTIGALVAVLCSGTVRATSEAWNLETLTSNGVKVAEAALANPTRANHKDWTYGTFYTGLTAFGLAHPKLRYLDVLRQEGTNYAWRLDGGRPFYAESHCIGQPWLELARLDDCPAALTATREVFDYVLENRSRAPVVQRTASGRFASNQLRWSWSDALFMSPPTWARLAALTGEDRYRDFMISEYRATTARLYDRDVHLFYRDYGRRDQKSANDAKVFWGRGNGWVLGGLPLVIRELPADLRSRAFFEDLFRDMCAEVKSVQREDGAWSPSLLDGKDPDLQEMSATALFCYALMWGINNDLLPAAEYLPCVRKSWTTLCRNVSAEGEIGWVQQAAVGPTKNYTAESTALYAVGAYLLAATEIRKHVILEAHPDAKRVLVGPLPRYGQVTAQVPLADLPQTSDLVVFDERDGVVVPHQLWDANGDKKPDTLLFRATLTAGVPAQFRVFSDPKLKSGASNLPTDGWTLPDFVYLRDGKTYRAPKATNRRVVEQGPVRTVVVFDIPAVDCGGCSVTEHRRVQIERGARFALCRSSFTPSRDESLWGGPVLVAGESEFTTRSNQGLATCLGEKPSAVCLRGPALVQSVTMGEILVARPVVQGQPLTWLCSIAAPAAGVCTAHAQWTDLASRAADDLTLIPPVTVK